MVENPRNPRCVRFASASLFGLLMIVPVVILSWVVSLSGPTGDLQSGFTIGLIAWACVTLLLALNAGRVMDFLLQKGSSLDRESMALSLLGFANFGVAVFALLLPA